MSIKISVKYSNKSNVYKGTLNIKNQNIETLLILLLDVFQNIVTT